MAVLAGGLDQPYPPENEGLSQQIAVQGLLVTEMPISFFKFYVLRRHIFGGWKGFMFALSAAFCRTLRIAKMLERGG